ncbi:MAG: peptide deformylase [Eubacteriales bacterium]|nr:peptide deformylase [Eubacteriales bacterium]
MIREIIKHPDPVLYKKCHAVTKFDTRLGKILDDMADTMMDANGVGLAGPQIGMLRRMCVVLDTTDNDKVIELINPEVVETSGSQTGPEGCLSFPDEFGTVTRPRIATVRAQDRHGEWFTLTREDLTARAFLHEIDHLDGHVFKEKVEDILEPQAE